MVRVVLANVSSMNRAKRRCGIVVASGMELATKQEPCQLLGECQEVDERGLGAGQASIF